MKINFGVRLRSARKMAGLSMEKLSEKADHIVTKQAISKYEKGQMKPDSKVLVALSKALNVPPDYFFRTVKIQFDYLEFRKKAKLRKKEQEKIKQQSLDFLERYIEIENILKIQSKFDNPISDKIISSVEDAENVAGNLRKVWELGQWAIPNVLELLEKRGVKVIEIKADDSFDGLSAWVDKIPVIVLNKKFNADLARKRFTALHEFAHLIFNFSKDADEKSKEKLCHSFAGAFLLPKEVLINELLKKRKRISLEELISIKETFGISIQAIMARAKEVQIITGSEYKRFNMIWNKRGYRKNEPGKYQGVERTECFKNLINLAVAEDIISMSKASTLANKPLAEFRREYNQI